MGDYTYTTDNLPYPPPVSKKTIPMIGFLVDVYGLEEAPPSAPITALWLLHPRTRSKAYMHDIASRSVHAWHNHQAASEKRGLIALCFDQPNHGSRIVSEKANQAWNKGNESHAIDMVGMVKGGVTDLRSLMDLAGGYLGLEGRIDGNVVLGWSLGGHGAWHSLFVEERMDAGVVVVGCPDLMGKWFFFISLFIAFKLVLRGYTVPLTWKFAMMGNGLDLFLHGHKRSLFSGTCG